MCKIKPENKPSVLLALSVFLLAMGLYGLLYQLDNKYTAGAPYGYDGVFAFSEADLQRETPMFLVDGWELYPDATHTPADFAGGSITPPRYTFIGQYPNFSFFTPGHSPFGRATYRLTLCTQSPQLLALELPEIFTEYTLWVDGKPLARTGERGLVSFAASTATELILNVENNTHYYSGLTYPPALGTEKTVGRMLLLRGIFYGLLCLFPLSLSLFAAVSLRTRGYDKRFLYFGLLCLFFGLRCAYPLVAWLGMTGRLWYTAEDVLGLAALGEIAALCAFECDLYVRPLYRKVVRPLAVGFCAFAAISVLFIIPAAGGFINIYGAIVDFYKLLCFGYLVFCAIYGTLHRHSGSPYILAVCAVMGASLLLRVLGNSRFEPIYGGWQTEHASLFFVVIFWVLIVRHIRNLLRVNRELTGSLTALVDKRTGELQSVLEERKAFFSNLAHDMKAPITAISGFISLILRGNLYLDDDLKGYLKRISGENEELSRRVQSLASLNDFDKIDEPARRLGLNKLLREVWENNEPEAAASGIYLTVQAADGEAYLQGVHQKLLILFENLIYNAIAFTPADGNVTIAAETADGFAVIAVSDTGSGIAPGHLPHIFERFYVGRENKSEGSGLGLYIAKLTVDEMGGSIIADSVQGKGTTFTIRLPLAKRGE